MSERPIRVGIRGVSGHLGRRLIQVLPYQADMEFTLGLCRDDDMKPEFEMILEVMLALGEPVGGSLPCRLPSLA